MKRITEGRTSYEKELLQNLKTKTNKCKYKDYSNIATELFYIDHCDLHFKYCEKCAKFIEKENWQKGKLIINIETKEQKFEINK